MTDVVIKEAESKISILRIDRSMGHFDSMHVLGVVNLINLKQLISLITSCLP